LRGKHHLSTTNLVGGLVVYVGTWIEWSLLLKILPQIFTIVKISFHEGLSIVIIRFITYVFYYHFSFD